MTAQEKYPNEEWANIPDFPNHKISKSGKVFGVHKQDNLSTYISSNGYWQVDIEQKGKRFKKRIHRLIATAFILNPLNKPHINHIDGVKVNNNIENLEWVTAKENIHHAIKIGLFNTEKRRKSVNARKGIIPKGLSEFCNDGKNNPRSKEVHIFDQNRNYIRTFQSGNLCAQFLKRRQSNMYVALTTGSKCNGVYLSYNKNILGITKRDAKKLVSA